MQDVLRKSHGTGIGFSSTAAFWIPDKPPEPAPAPQRMKQLGRPPKQPDGASKRSERLLGGRARDAGKLGLDRERNRAERRGMDRDSDDDREPPQVLPHLPHGRECGVGMSRDLARHAPGWHAPHQRSVVQ